MKKQLYLLGILFFGFQFGFSVPTPSRQTTTCPKPIGLSVVGVGSNTATLGWTAVGGTTSFHVLCLPASSPAPGVNATGWVAASTSPFTVTDLTPLTNYTFYVRATCGPILDDWSLWAGPFNFMTTSSPAVCGGTFTDPGGANGDYPANSNSTTTICPSAPGEAVTVTFTSFNTESGSDVLSVYNGNTVTPNTLMGTFSGSSLPAAVTSTAANGCLTFVFVSNGSVNGPGWVAGVSCGPMICEPPTNLTVNSIANTSAVINWTNPNGMIGWEILVVPFGSPAPTANTQGAVFVTASPFVISGLTPNVCYTAYVRTYCSEWSAPVSFCMSDCSNTGQCLDSLQLTAFLDANNNGIKDSGEMNFTDGQYLYSLSNSGNPVYAASNNGSFFIFDNNPANSYNLSFSVNPTLAPYFSSAASYSNITLAPGSGNTIYYFPITQTQSYNDLEVGIFAANPVPGFTSNITLIYRNKSFLPVTSGTLTFTKGAAVSITNISQPGTTPNATGFSYNFTNMAPGETRLIQITVQVPTIPTVNLGQLITHSASIGPVANDAYPSDNTASVTTTVVGSYDPNDKNEAHGRQIDIDDFTAADYLTYTIRFENTGTANAQFIRIEDLLDSKLNPNTVVFLNSSHPVNVRRTGNKLIWNFYNIQLPPTITNPNASHGFVRFKVKPYPGYTVGTIIPNKGDIYFDYNPPIITELYETEFVDALGTAAFETASFSMIPNPANNWVQLRLADATEKIKAIVVYDVLGKAVKEISEIDANQINLNVEGLATGIYSVVLHTNNGLKQVKRLSIK